MKSLSHVWLFATPWTIAHQAPLSMEFSRQEYWSGLPFPSPGDLSNPGIKLGSPTLQADALPSEPPGKPYTPKELIWKEKKKSKKNQGLHSITVKKDEPIPCFKCWLPHCWAAVSSKLLNSATGIVPLLVNRHCISGLETLPCEIIEGLRYTQRVYRMKTQ